MSTFRDATLMITGGTGSFGNTVLKHFLATDIKEIRIFSRDEKKQDDMRHELQAKHPEYASKVKFYIGDVRNRQTLDDAMPGVDYIFHAAALKQVPSCEFFPMEAVRTNVEGTDNMGDQCRGQACCMPFYRQGSLSDQRNGNLQSNDGARDLRKRKDRCRARRHGHLLHKIRQCHVLQRLRHTAVH